MKQSFLGVPRSLVTRLGWTMWSYGVAQFLRLLNSVIVSRLLSPPIFGLMAVVNAVRTGIELLSDVGIIQNIISNPKGDTPTFYDTAWTLQVLRGLALGGICIALSGPVAKFFNYPELAQILPVSSLFFVFTGFTSTARGLIQKQLLIRRSSVFAGISIGLTVLCNIGAALVTKTVWALVIGAVVGAAANLVITYLLIPGTRHRFIIDRDCARQMFRFGKWVFISSIIYFFATNFDRLYFAKQISLSQLGVYGIARSLADMVTGFVQRCTNFVLYPTVAAAGLAPAALRQRILRGRRTLLLAAAIFMGAFVALSDVAVHLLYDARWSEAATILPILCIGVWFGILTATNDAILLGLSRPAYTAISNAAKLATYVIGVPLAFYLYGFVACVIVISAGEIVKYVALWILSHKERLHFGRDDLALTLAFGVTAVLVRQGVTLIGLNHVGHVSVRALIGSLGL